MARASRRSEKEIQQLLKGYAQSGLTRRQYCEQHAIPVTTFDYYRSGRRRPSQERRRQSTPLVKVELARQERLPEPAQGQADGFTVEFLSGRRIKSNWNYSDQKLARLIRIVEAV